MHGVGDENINHFLHKSTLFSVCVSVYISCHLVVLKCAVRNILRNVQSYQQKPEVQFGLHIEKRRGGITNIIFFSFDKITKYKMIN